MNKFYAPLLILLVIITILALCSAFLHTPTPKQTLYSSKNYEVWFAPSSGGNYGKFGLLDKKGNFIIFEDTLSQEIFLGETKLFYTQDSEIIKGSKK